MADRRRDWIPFAIGLGATLAVILLLMVPGRRVPLDQRLTTMRTSPDGAAALYELLVALDIPVERRMTPLDGITPIGGALALLAPTQPLDPAERDSLVRWVERGGTLIAALAYGDPLLRRLGLAPEFVGAGGGSARSVPDRLTEGVDSVGSVFYVLDVADTTALIAIEPLVVAGDDDRIVALRARLGRGTVVLLSDHRILSNGRLRAAGAAPIFARAAAEAARAGHPLVFDEYHHGYRGGTPTGAFFDFLFGAPAGWLFLQLALVAALAALPAAVRFGAPVAAAAAPRRSPLEHVAALGEVYRQARAADLARRRLLVGFARRLGRERPPAGGEVAFLDRVGRGAPGGADAVAAVSRAWRQRLPVRELAERIDEALNRLNRTA
ncbi:MAG TPA: DUF4350 domain-containing protein [Longimicrobiales bacterium]|nr:DUF4350 domain-containing protein [Longimicrobiales bacterium]